MKKGWKPLDPARTLDFVIPAGTSKLGMKRCPACRIPTMWVDAGEKVYAVNVDGTEHRRSCVSKSRRASIRRLRKPDGKVDFDI